MNVKICIDAGHYGKYNRSPAVKDYYESNMAWKLHLLQKQYLEEYEGVTVITTRSNQATDKALYDRGACSKGCDLFISDHSNAVGSGINESVDYVAIYHLTDDSTTRVDDISREIAGKLAPVIADVMGTSQGWRLVTRESGNDRNGDGMLNDNYYGVLHGARMVNTPGMIIEHSFHTNTRMTKWLLDDGNLARLAKAEVEVIAKHFGLKKKSTICADAGTQTTIAPDMFVPYSVKVKVADLNIRKDATVDSHSVGYTGKGIFTIVEEKAGKITKSGAVGLWGRLKSGAGWICLALDYYVERV